MKKIIRKIKQKIRDWIKAKVLGEHFNFWINPKIKENSEQFKKIQYAIKQYVRNGKDDLLNLYTEKGLLRFNGVNKNIIVTAGRSVIAEILTGGTTYTGQITDGALGNGVSPSFTNASTQLVSEVGRKSASDSAFDENIAYIDFFFASGDIADGTYTEWGTFIDGDGSTADDGIAFSLLATGNWEKSGSCYISSRYTII
jgi:hypothetical protein